MTNYQKLVLKGLCLILAFLVNTHPRSDCDKDTHDTKQKIIAYMQEVLNEP